MNETTGKKEKTMTPVPTRRGRVVRHGAPRRAAPGFELWRGSDGQLWARTADRTCSVRPVRCFPWANPSRFISLRDRDDEEVALVRDLGERNERMYVDWLEEAIETVGRME